MNLGGQNFHSVCLFLRLVLTLACLEKGLLKGAISCTGKKSQTRKECQTVKDCIRNGVDKHLGIVCLSLA